MKSMVFLPVVFFLFLLALTATSGAFEPLFDARVDYFAGDGVNGVAMGDIDGDGDRDIAGVTYGDKTLVIFRNDGGGHLEKDLTLPQLPACW